MNRSALRHPCLYDRPEIDSFAFVSLWFGRKATLNSWLSASPIFIRRGVLSIAPVFTAWNPQ